MKKRVLYKELMKYIDHKNALVITGMRQVGKTTLMQQVFDTIDQPKIWFDFDNPLDQKIFEELDYNNIYKSLQSLANTKKERLFVFIDEIQNYPEITKVIKYLIDHYAVKFIVTGSSSFYLKNLFPESLSGRKFLFNLNPLSFQEYLYFTDQQKEITLNKKRTIKDILKPISLIQYEKNIKEYQNYLEFGGFPEVVLTQDRELKKKVLKNIFASFFEKDLKIIADYKDIRELRDLILLLVPRVGTMLDITKLAGELGVDRPKIYNYLEFLQGVFFIKLLPKFSQSIDRAVAGGKKVYFSDTGILNVIGRVNDGQLFENSVINQLSEFGQLSFYNKRNTAEIDVVLDKKIAFEIKLTPTENDLNKLENISEKIGIDQCYLIGKNYRDFRKTITATGL